MNLASMKAATKLAANRNLLKIKKNSPTILMVAGIAGMVTGQVLTARATLKLEGVIDEIDEKLAKAKALQQKLETGEVTAEDLGISATPEDFQRANVVIYAKGAVKIAKLYAVPALVTAASIAAIVSGHTILDRRNVVLAASYVALDKTFGNYRQKVIDAFGMEKEKELYVATIEEDTIDPATGEVRSTFPVDSDVSMYGRWFAKGNPNWETRNESNFTFLRSQQNYLNDLLRARGYVFLNEVYAALGFEQTSAGQLVGWIYKENTGDDYIDFGLFPDSGGRGIIHYDDLGENPRLWLDFNVDGVVYHMIDNRNN